jgi:hypothetical protein
MRAKAPEGLSHVRVELGASRTAGLELTDTALDLLDQD